MSNVTCAQLFELLGQVSATQLDFMIALRNALVVRDIGPDFFRFVGTPDGRAALESAMDRLAYTYRLSLSGSSDLLTPVHGGICQFRDVPHKTLFDASQLREYSAVEVTDAFWFHFAEHWIMPRSGSDIASFALSAAAYPESIILSLGVRPYADMAVLISLLDDINSCRPSPLFTTHSNLFCALNTREEPCVVEMWYHHGWHFDAHPASSKKLFDPACRVLSPVGVREKKLV